MNIRSMKMEDYNTVISLWQRTPGMGLNEIDDSREGIEKFLIRNPTTNFVVEDSGTLIGSILCGHDGRRAFFYHTAIAADYQRQGIGEKLVERVMEALKKEGITKISLVAYKKNEVGNEFWNKLGFEERVDLTYRNRFV